VDAFWELSGRIVRKVKLGARASYTRFEELSILMVILFARSSMPLARVRLRHIQDGFVNKLFDIFEKSFGHVKSNALAMPVELHSELTPEGVELHISKLPGIVELHITASVHGIGPSSPATKALSSQ
jgi:hypothetical protein